MCRMYDVRLLALPSLVETQESFGANQRDAALSLTYRQTSARN
jgi:hypothetical protein